MVASILSAALALVSTSSATPALSGHAEHSATFPAAGVVIPGQSIGGITIGMTQAQVKARWGVNYVVCASCGPNLTWLFEYPGGSAALGAAIKFTTPSTLTASSGSSSAKAALAAESAAAAKALAAGTKEQQADATAKADATKATAAETTLKTARAAKVTAARLATLEAAAKAASASAATAAAAATKANAAAKLAAAAAQAAKTAAAQAASAAAANTQGTVVAVFTLGSPAGWGVPGVMMGDPVSNIYNLFGNPESENCIGYSALSVRIGQSTTSFYSSSGVIYGYALTAATESVCQ